MATTVETFNASTSWVAPQGTFRVQVECYGSGAAGGTSVVGNGGGGGGGGGAYSLLNTFLSTPGTSYTVTVGVPADNATGIDSFFNTAGTAMAKGGVRGGNGTLGGGGSAGTGGTAAASVGDVKRNGGTGGVGNGPSGGGGGGGGGAGTNVAGGTGGDATAVASGAGGAGGTVNGGAGGDGGPTAGGGLDGNPNGGGGGGAFAGSALTSQGARGQVVLTYNPTEFVIGMQEANLYLQAVKRGAFI
jgi:hypothetical protein